MPEITRICLIYATFPDSESARAAAQSLLGARLVACCTMLPAAESHYVWEGAMQVANETVMVCKTTGANAAAAMAAITAAHPYKNPAILQLPVQTGAEKFLTWVEEITATP